MESPTLKLLYPRLSWKSPINHGISNYKVVENFNFNLGFSIFKVDSLGILFSQCGSHTLPYRGISHKKIFHCL